MEQFRAEVGDVYLYKSAFLKKENDSAHFHPVVLDIALSHIDGMPKKGVVIITTHTEQKEKDMKSRFGENSCVIINQEEYGELNRKSMISCRIYEEDDDSLQQEDKKGTLSEETVKKIKAAARQHKLNSKRIKNLF